MTPLELREARAFIDDELLAEREPRRRRLLSLVQEALTPTATPPHRIGGYQPTPFVGDANPPPRTP